MVATPYTGKLDKRIARLVLASPSLHRLHTAHTAGARRTHTHTHVRTHTHALQGLSLLQYHIYEGLSFMGTTAPLMVGKRLEWLGVRSDGCVGSECVSTRHHGWASPCRHPLTPSWPRACQHTVPCGRVSTIPTHVTMWRCHHCVTWVSTCQHVSACVSTEGG